MFNYKSDAAVGATTVYDDADRELTVKLALELAQRERKIDDLQASIRLVEERLASAQTEIVKLTKRLLEERNIGAEQRTSSRARDVNDSRLPPQVTELLADLELTELTDLHNAVQSIRSDRERLSQEVRILKSEREALLSSTSWRITSPVRKLKNALVKQ